MTGEAAFSIRVEEALGNARLRENFRGAMDELIRKRLDHFRDERLFHRLSGEGAAIRARALAKLPDLLERLEMRLKQNGIEVHWAEDAAEANEIVLAIIREQGCDSVIKGKSMVTEEIGLNDFLESRNIDVLETDLGEYILQLLGDRPSHIVMPAIHRSKQEIAELFARRFPQIPYSEDVDELTAMARKVLREAFRRARVGISGVNFAVAETGTLCLVENEGNGRMCTTLPDVHIAVTGIEKVVEKLADVPPLLGLLTRSATGQPITTYFNMISSPRRPGEKDGPRAVHLVLVDNGRSAMFARPDFQATLRCIRCGACMNHCPVYTRIGGHAYGTTYPGPIGMIFAPQQEGLDRRGEMLSASTLCNACTEVCPVRIPIADLINRLRHERVSPGGSVPGAGSGRRWKEALLWRLWRWVYANPARYRRILRLLAKHRERLPQSLRPWSDARALPEVAEKSLHQRLLEKGEGKRQ